jgi:hypothetical protein
MAIETTEQIVREAPELEAIKMNLLSEAAKLAYRPEFGQQLPGYQVAGFAPGQQAAINAAMQQGVGSFLPMISQAQQSIGGGLQAAQAGLGALDVAGATAMGAGGMYDPRAAYGFMNPYQDAVTQETLREIRRQADIAGQGQAAQAVRSGAFGGTREGVQRAEMERNTQNIMAQQIAQLNAQNFAQAQNAAMQSDEAARQRQLGIGSLVGQLGQAYGSLGQQMGQAGIQQASLGQTAQQLQQGDIQLLYGLGQAEQAQRQKEIDAGRATQMQQIYAPYQQAAFLSDIYKGAPSAQMSTTAASVPQASPFQQVAGTALGALSTYGAGKVAGVF